MKNKITKLLPLFFIPFLISGCNRNSNSGSTDWSDEIKEEMNLYLGTVLPFVQLDRNTLEHGYSDAYEAFGIGVYYLFDCSETNLLDGYDGLLIEDEYTLIEDEEYGNSYEKVTSIGTISVSFGWYEATDEEEAGNSIAVSCPIYEEPLTEELLIEYGYVKQTGWPTEQVAKTLEGSGYSVEGVNTDGDWFVASDTYTDEDEGYYYECLYLASYGDYGDEFAQNCLDAGFIYDEDYECYYEEAHDSEIYISSNNGFVVIDIYGPSLTISGSEEDVTGETTNEDGSITVSFTFESNLVNGTAYDGKVFESTSASLTINKGDANTAPTYYDNGNTLRFYPNSNFVIAASDGLTIVNAKITVGPSNSKKLFR